MYDKYYEINKNFQSSVNLELDLDNESKIYEYVPTSDICDVLKKYIKAVLGKTKDRATTLVGPYGKGIVLFRMDMMWQDWCWRM